MIWWSATRALARVAVGVMLVVPALVVADDAVPAALPTPLAKPDPAGWGLRLPVDGKVSYRGVVGFDQAGTGGGAMVYPAPSAVGLLVAVLAHGAIVESAKNAQKEKMQADANKVLSPYLEALNSFDARELMRRALGKATSRANGRLIELNDDPGQEIVVQSVPVFSLTQDQKAIVLDNTIGIRMPGAAAASAYQSTIHVVSGVKEFDEPVAYWTSNNAERLKEESAQLVAESLVIALQYIAVDAQAPSAAYRTVRYREGSMEKMERAQVLSTHCERLLIRTLRGLLMSVPTSGGSSPSEGCVAAQSASN